MRVRILGSAAGGGFPQWNCRCPTCQAARSGSRPCRPRTQCSIAVSADDRDWFLFNVSPDVRSQIEGFPLLQPQQDRRHTPIQAVILSDAELDHTAGLLSLREGRCLRIYATPWVYDALTTENPILRTLAGYCDIDYRPLQLDQATLLECQDGTTSPISCRPFLAGSGKRVAFSRATVQPEATVAFDIFQAGSDRVLCYAPAVQESSPDFWARLHGREAVLLDGTCWRDDELVSLGLSTKTCRSMGHVPMHGPDGTLHRFARAHVSRKVYTHINNTNPVLIDDSPERGVVEAAGIEIGYDGMELEL